MTKLRKRHKDLARKLHQYFRANSGCKFVEWDKLTESQKDFWYNCAVNALEREEQKAA